MTSLTRAVMGKNGRIEYGVPGVLQQMDNTPLPSDIVKKLLNDLSLDDFKNFRLVSKQHKVAVDFYKVDVDSKYTFGRKIDAAAHKFMDRPLGQRIAIVVFVTLTSPVSVPILLVVRSPKIYKKYKDTHILPFVRKVADATEKVFRFVFYTVPKAVYDTVIDPVVQMAVRTGRWTTTNVLKPVAEVIQKVAKAVFVTFPSYVNKTVLTPAGSAIKKAYLVIQEDVLKPVAHAIARVVKAVLTLAKNALVATGEFLFDHVVVPLAKAAYKALVNIIIPVAKAIFITLPSKIIEYVVVPAARLIGKGISLAFNHVIAPTVRVIGIIAKAIFITVPSKVAEHVLVPVIKAVTNTVIIPVAKVVQVIAKALFVTLPAVVFNNVVAPVANFIGTVLQITYSTIIKPAAQLVGSVASTILFEVIPAAVSFVWTPVSTLVTEVASASLDLGRFVFSKM